MSYSFNHKSESGVVGTGSYIFRHYSSGRPLSTSMYYKLVWDDNYNFQTLYLRSSYASGYNDCSILLSGNYNYSQIPWNGNVRLRYVEIEEDIVPSSTKMWFDETIGLMKINNIGRIRTDYVTSTYGMFHRCMSSFESTDFATWNTSNVTNMGLMFSDSSIENLDLSNWDTSNVTNMRGVFWSCDNLETLDLSSWDTSKVTDMELMFQGCTNLTYLDLSHFEMSNVTNTTNMFTNTPNVTTAYCKDAANKAILDQICEDCGVSWRFTIKGPSTSLYYKIVYGVIRERNYTMYISDKKLDNDYIDATSALTATRVEDVTWRSHPDPAYHPIAAISYVRNVVFETYVLPQCTCYWFAGFTNLNTFTNLYRLDTKYVTRMDYMFQNSGPLNNLDLSSFDTSNVTNMYAMFSACTSLTSLNVSGWNVSNVTNMMNMFSNCTSLTSIDVSGWSSFRSSGSVALIEMFYNCSQLLNIDLSDWRIGNNANISDMFGGDSAYRTNRNLIDLSGFDMSLTTVQNYHPVFTGVTNVQTAYCRTQADKVILDQLVIDSGYSWTFTVKS